MRKFYTLLVALVTAFAANADTPYLRGAVNNWLNGDNWDERDQYQFTYADGNYYFQYSGDFAGDFKIWLNDGNVWYGSSNAAIGSSFSLNSDNASNINLGTIKNPCFIFNETDKTLKVLSGEDLSVASDEVVVYFTNPDGWEAPRIWAWNGGTNCNTLEWPGDYMTKDGDLWKWILPEGKPVPTMCLFNSKGGDDKVGNFEFVNGGIYNNSGLESTTLSTETFTGRFYNIEKWNTVTIEVYNGDNLALTKELPTGDHFLYNFTLIVPTEDKANISVVYTDGEGNECAANWVGDGMTDLNGELPAPKLDETTWPSGSARPTAGQQIVWTVEIGTINIESSASDAQNVKARTASVPTNWELSTDGKTATYTYPEDGDNNIYKLTAVLEGAQSDFFVLDLTNDGGVSGVTDVDADNNAEAVYFNLQGVRVAGELTPGMYICRQGDKVSKVVVR